MSPSEEGGLDLFPSIPPGAESEPPLWSVSAVNRAVRSLLEGQFSDFWVGGELANWTRARSGHRYFTLKDDQAQLRCVMWRRDADRLPTEPEEGMKVRARGCLTIYEARGEYQLSVRQLEGEGEQGLWRLAFERIRRRLEEEGLFDPARKREIPKFPRSVGVVTSLEGAALHDILTVIRRRAPWTRVVVRACRVQGEGAAQEIADAVHLLGRCRKAEVLIVGRGGGSIEDLWAFNEEPVARAIVECGVPVISAVGHEVDVTIADLVADLRAPTPSAAGEAAVHDRGALSEVLNAVQPRLARALRHQTDRRRQRLREGALRAASGIQRLIEPRRGVLERRTARINSAMRSILHLRREQLGSAAGRVETLSPLSTLRRGYAVPLDSRARVLRGASDFRIGESFDLRIVDGRIRCETLDVREESLN